MDQTLVRSGFDVEIALGSRYLQYLLLLAVEAGALPVETTFADPLDPIRAVVHVPDTLDRTYVLDPNTPQGEPYPGEDPFAVEILHDHASGADLRVKVLVHLTQASSGLNVTNMEIGLFVRLTPQTERDPDGAGLASLMLGIELVDVDGLLVEYAAERGVTKQEILTAMRTGVNSVLDLGDVGSGGRLEDLALRKHPADGATPAALGIYLNLRLKVGPQPDRFLAARGDVALARNILDPESDLTFATRHDLPGHFAKDAFFRRAEPSGSGYTYPIRSKGERIGKVNEILALTTLTTGTLNKLQIIIDGEYELDWVPNPGFSLVVGLSGGVDDDGVMTWHSSAELDSGLLVDLVLGLIAGALVPLLGPWALAVFAALEIGKEIAEEVVSEAIVEEKVDQRVDASLLDVAPNRLTMLRRRWDPFYATHHQIGLRPGGTLINSYGIALWGRAVLTRQLRPVPGVIIRDSQRDADGTPTHLRYRVQDIDPFRDQLDQPAPGADRAAFTHTDDPYLFQIEVDGAIDRIARDRLLGAPYLVKRVEMNPSANAIAKLLVISERESNEQRGRLIAEHRAAATAQITQDHQAEIRAAVIAEFTALGVIPTPEQIDTEVAARLRDLIDADVADYADGPLAGDLEAALLPLLRFELSPTHFGRLQGKKILTLKDYVRVHIVADDRYYYRDRFVRPEEPTPAKQAADNLRNRPRYRSTPQGPIFT